MNIIEEKIRSLISEKMHIITKIKHTIKMHNKKISQL